MMRNRLKWMNAPGDRLMATIRADIGKRLPRQIVLALLAVLLGIILTGCVEIEIRSEYRQDGSASHTIQLQVTYVPANRDEADDLTAILGELEERSIAAGLEYEQSDEEGLITVLITGTTSEGQEAGAALNSMINATGINASPGVAAPFRGTFQRETGPVGGSSYVLDLTVDGGLLFESVVIERLNSPRSAWRNAVDMTYVATLPGNVVETSGEKLDSKTVRWTIANTGVTELDATARTGGFGSALLFLVAGVASMVVAIGLGVGFGWYFARRRRLSLTLSGPLHRIPDQQTITREGIWVARKISGVINWLQGTESALPGEDRPNRNDADTVA